MYISEYLTRSPPPLSLSRCIRKLGGMHKRTITKMVTPISIRWSPQYLCKQIRLDTKLLCF